MEQTWTISGVHGDWTMTVTSRPPETEDDETVRHVPVPPPDFRPLVGHFRNLVELNELQGELALR